MPPLDDEKIDDAFDDARAAYAEVAAKSTDASATVATADTNAGSPAGEKSPEGGPKPVVRAPSKDERGRFARKTEEKPAGAEKGVEATEAGENEEQAPEAQEAPSKAIPAGGPPSSWTVKSKSSWDELPEHVRADIAKREGEVSQGFAALKDYKDLKPFAEMAAKHNTTIAAALKHYTGIEGVLRKDIGQGLATIVQNYGLNQQQAAQLFTDLARKYGGSAPGPAAATPPGQNNPAGAQLNPNDPLYNILKPFIEPLQQELSNLRKTHTSREQADRNAAEQSLAKAIEVFSGRPENRYYTDLEETITRLFETGMVPLTGNHEGDLTTAYSLAAQMVPEVREALIEQRIREQKDAARLKEQEAAAKARNASRSITGSRVPGTVVQQPGQNANGFDDVEADVRAAYRQLAQH